MEENKTLSFDKVKFKLKVEQAKRKVVSGVKSAAAWCMENKELVAVMAGGGLGIAKVMGKIHGAHREDYVHDRRHWDPRAGEYVESRRKLSKCERLELDERYRAGESKIHILDDMGLLK